MSEKRCGTDCREDLLCRISQRVERASVWKIISVLVVLTVATTTLSFGIAGSGIKNRELSIKENMAAIVSLKEKMASIDARLCSLKEGQGKILEKIK